ncbi:MAG: hypothetical protein U1D55_08585 [Phycisphaerae bacterium]
MKSVATILIALSSMTAFAQSFDLSWNAVAGGGGTLSGGSFSVTATIGQPAVGEMSGGGFTVRAGFWPAVATPEPCPGDLNGDRAVNSSDLGILLGAWQAGAGGDLDGDHDTDSSDLGILLANWQNACP